jgi:hypothetical protein
MTLFVFIWFARHEVIGSDGNDLRVMTILGQFLWRSFAYGGAFELRQNALGLLMTFGIKARLHALAGVGT